MGSSNTPSSNTPSSNTPKTIFDFSSPASVAAWQIVNDGVMGGVSASSFRWKDGVAVFSGRVSLENNGGFASVRSLPFPHSLAETRAFLVRARGDGALYKLTVRMTGDFDGVVYQRAFSTVAGEWQELRLDVVDFHPTFRGRTLPQEPPLDPSRVTSLGFLISDRQAGLFQLEVAWIQASPRA